MNNRLMEESESLLVNQQYLLEKFPGKGGWTYAMIPEVIQNKSFPFGWVKVRGRIDEYELKECKLMPMGNNRLFLPVRAEIRKRINKQAGDLVHIVLYANQEPPVNTDDFLLCLQESPQAYKTYFEFTEERQKAITDWIDGAKSDHTKVQRMATAITCLEKGEIPL